MLKKVKVTTHLTTITDNGNDTIRTETAGLCRVDDDALLLQFAEAENEGRAALLVTDAIADLKRKGNITSRMTFIEGRLVPCNYQMQEGAWALSIFTHSKKHRIDAGGGMFETSYSILTEGAHLADNTLRIEFSFIE